MEEKTFLVIENDAATADVITQTLESRGHSVFKAADGSVGISMAEKVTPSLIFLNLSTPGTNGLGICKAFKEIESLKNVPIVLLTLREGKFDAMYKTLFGIAGFMKKPITQEAILSKLQNVMPDIETGKAPVPEEPVEPGEMEEQPLETETQALAEEPAEEMPSLMAEVPEEEPLFQDIEEPEELPEEEPPLLPPVEQTLIQEVEEAEETASLEESREEEEPKAGEKGLVFQEIEEVETPEPEEAVEEEPAFEGIEEKEELPLEGEEVAGKERAFGEYLKEEAFPEKQPIEQLEEQPEEQFEQALPVEAERPARSRKIIYSVAFLAAIGIILSVAYTVFIKDKHKETPAEVGTSEEQVSIAVPPEPGTVQVGPKETPDISLPGQAVEEPAAEQEVPVETPEEPEEIVPEKAPEAAKPETLAAKPKSPIAKPEPVAVKPYHVQFGAFGVQGNAVNLSRKLKGKGLDVFIHKGTTRSGKPLYRVLLLGGFDSSQAAGLQAKQIKNSKKLDTAVYRIPQ
jgi:CheY-like chemotaxis protein/cell division protein FtsN